MYEFYFVRRLVAELELAEQSDNLLERSIHLQACRYYRELIDLHRKAGDSEAPGEVIKP